MPNDKQKKVLREMEQKAKLYAAKSTQLSNQLEEAEQFLQQMPGKMQLTVMGNRPEDVLEFCRVSDEWRLYYGVGEDGAWVTESTVQIKAAAARLLPFLVKKLMATQTDNLAKVETGLEALSGLPFLSDKNEGGAE